MVYKVRLDKPHWRECCFYLLVVFMAGSMMHSHQVLAASHVTNDWRSPDDEPLLSQTVEPEGEPFPELEPLPPAEEPFLPLPLSPDDEVTDDGTQIAVREIQVVGSSVFTSDELSAVVAPFENRVLTLGDLQQAAAAITELYLQAGYITSRAVLPDQTAADGIVQILVIEGEVSDIQVEGSDRLERYVRDRVALGTESPLNQLELEDQLQLLQFDPLVESIEANLRAGNELGESILTVGVIDAKPFNVDLVLDNYSPETVGRERIGANISYLNPLRLGDEVFASTYISFDGGANVYELGYRVPLNAMNGTLQARYVHSNFRIVNPEAANIPDVFDIEGSANLFNINFRQPLIRTPREEFALSGGFRYRSGETLISDFVVDDSRVSVIEFGQDYLRRDLNGAWAFQSQFNIGTGLFNATVDSNSDLPDGSFLSWQGQAQRVQLLGPNQTLILQANLQFATDTLLGSEQFIIGGGRSVRGYTQNVRSGDNGFRFAVEDRFVVLRNQADEPFLQVVPFVDMGVIWNDDASQNIQDDNFLLGSGVGVILNPIPQIDIRFDLGIPLIEIDDPGEEESAQVYFQFVYSP